MIRCCCALLMLLSTPALAGPCADSAEGVPAPYNALVRAELALRAGDADVARADLAKAESVASGPATRFRLQLLGRASAGDAAVKHLSSALNGVSKAGARTSRCDADPAETRWHLYEATGDAKHLLEIWTRNPTSGRSGAVEGILRELDPTFPDRDTALERVATLATMHQHKEALVLLESSVSDDGTKEHALARARALFRAKEYARYVAAVDALSDPPLQDRFDAALATSRTGDYGAAALRYQALVDEFAASSKPPALIDSASYKLGYLAYDGGDPAAGVRLFREHFARFPKTKHATEALWFIGWSLFRTGEYAESQAAFAQLMNDHPRSTLVPGARYWSARAAGLLGDAAAERAGFEQVLVRHPDTSYAWWSARRLGRTWDAPVAPPQESGPTDPKLAVGLALLDAGLDDWAAAELELRVAAARKSGREGTLALAEQLAAAGQYKRSKALARGWCATPEARKDLRALKLCWPRPEGAAAMKAAAAGDLPKHLPFAIMKAESGFNPTVTSPAGARGLMQMMPKLGVALHAELHPDAPALDPEQLYDPAINAELGVAELVQLRATFADTDVDPMLPLVIAGYNGGAAAVRRWLATQPTPIEADRWAEDISYSETRRYVRRVLGALQVYRYVYGD